MKGLQATRDDSGAVSLALATLPKPALKPGYVLIRVVAAYINPSDVMNSQGGFPHTTFPRVMGRDFAGIVLEPESSPLVGKEVFGTSGSELSFGEDGVHAEFALVREKGLSIKPKDLSFAQAATLGTPLSTASLVLKRAWTKSTDTVMINGATGAVGGFVAQLATQMGCKVLTVSRHDTSSINSKKDPDLKTAKDITDGRGPDVFADTVGDTKLLQAALTILGPEGRLSFISTGRSASPEITVDMKDVYRQNHIIVGSNSVGYGPEKLAGLLSEMAPMFDTGELKAPQESALTMIKVEDAVAAYADMGKQGGKKYVIDFGTE